MMTFLMEDVIEVDINTVRPETVGPPPLRFEWRRGDSGWVVWESVVGRHLLG